MSTTTTNKSSQATSMAELLQKRDQAVKALHKGDKVTGVITKLTPGEILMDINAKTEALVIEKERRLMRTLLSMFKVGDTVTANVISPESERGFPVLTLRGYVEDLSWKKLFAIQKNQERIPVVVRESTRSGFLVETHDGVVGFLPNSHVGFTQNHEEMVGKEIKVGVLELTRETKKIIFSQKSVVSTEDFHKATSGMKIGDTIMATVSTITPFGLFASIPQKEKKAENMEYVDGLIHVSEISWERTPSDLTSLFTIGQEIEAMITNFDDNAKRIDLSIKRLTTDPFEDAIKGLSVDQKVTGKVKEINDTGVVVDLPAAQEYALTGLIRKDKIPPTVTYEVGKSIQITISQIDTKKRKILLVPVLTEKPLMYR